LLGSSRIPELEGDSELRHARGMSAAALYALAPAVNLFAYSVDAVIMCGAAWTLVAATRRLNGGHGTWMIAGGTLLAFTSFISFGALATCSIVVAAIGLRVASQGPWDSSAWRFAIVEVALLGAGFVAGWLVLCLAFPMQPLRIFAQAMHAHHAATVVYRSYRTWVWMNVAIFALFLGWPAALLGLAAGAMPIVAARRRGVAISDGNPVTLAGVIGSATWLTMLLLTLSGNVLGEVERLWLFLVPGCCVLAATAFALRGERRADRIAIAVWIVLLVLQAAQTLLMASALAPLIQPA
jgi:hypothetical protein